MILVDTSVWIDHFQRASALLFEALERGEVTTHPLVIGELACGNLNDRREVLHLLGRLPPADVASDQEVLHFIERRRLMGKGVGYIEVHLLASVTLTKDTRFWTRDKRLAAIAADLKIKFEE